MLSSGQISRALLCRGAAGEASLGEKLPPIGGSFRHSSRKDSRSKTSKDRQPPPFDTIPVLQVQLITKEVLHNRMDIPAYGGSDNSLSQRLARSVSLDRVFEDLPAISAEPTEDSRYQAYDSSELLDNRAPRYDVASPTVSDPADAVARFSPPHVYDNSGQECFDASLENLFNMVDTVRTGSGLLVDDRNPFATPPLCTGPSADNCSFSSPTRTMSTKPIFDSQACMDHQKGSDITRTLSYPELANPGAIHAHLHLLHTASDSGPGPSSHAHYSPPSSGILPAGDGFKALVAHYLPAALESHLPQQLSGNPPSDETAGDAVARGDCDAMDVDKGPAAPEMPAELQQLDPGFFRLGPAKICGKPRKEEDAEAFKGKPRKKKARRSEDQLATDADQPDIKDFAETPAEEVTRREKPKIYTGTNWHSGNKRWRALLSFPKGSATVPQAHHIGYFDSELEAAVAYDQIVIITQYLQRKTNYDPNFYLSKEELRIWWKDNTNVLKDRKRIAAKKAAPGTQQDKEQGLRLQR